MQPGESFLGASRFARNGPRGSDGPTSAFTVRAKRAVTAGTRACVISIPHLAIIEADQAVLDGWECEQEYQRDLW